MPLVTPTSGGLGIEIPITSDSKQFTDSVDRVNKKLKELEGLAKENAQLSSKIGTAQEQSAKKATMSWTDFRSMYQTVLDVVRVGQQVWAATGGEFNRYAEDVKNLSRNIGVTTEDASRLIQVADDVRISFASIGTATKTAQKQGIDVSIEGLKKLSAQYNKLPPGIQRSQFLLKTFGKSGLEMGKLMQVGAEGIDKMSNSVDANLILTQEAIKTSDDFKTSADGLGDAWQGFLMGPGQGVTKWLSDSAKGWTYQLTLLRLMKERGVSAFDNKAVQALSVEAYQLVNAEFDLKSSMAEAGDAADEQTKALFDNKEAVSAAKDELKNYQDALEAVSQANKDMEGMSRQIAQDQKAYAKDHADAAATLSKAITEGDAEGIAKAQADIQALEATWHESSQNMIYDMVLVGLSAGGLLDSEQAALDEYAVQAGIKTQADIDEANRRREIADSTINGILQSEDVLTEQRKVDAENLRLTSAVTSAENILASQQEAAAIGGVSQATMQEINNQTMLAGAARTTASVYASIKPGYSASLPTGISKSMADPRRGRTAQYALGGEFMIPMQYGNEGFNMGGMATASGGEKVTITPKGQAAGTVYNIYITNPKREVAEDSIKSALRNLVYTGSAN